MKLLLDTHVWIWSRVEPGRLGSRARALMTAEGTELWLSPISVWEVAWLIEVGRLTVNGDPGQWIRSALRAVPLRECALTSEVALQSRLVELPHADPADRFLAASAVVYGLELLTADRHLLAAAGVPALRADE